MTYDETTRYLRRMVAVMSVEAAEKVNQATRAAGIRDLPDTVDVDIKNVDRPALILQWASGIALRIEFDVPTTQLH